MSKQKRKKGKVIQMLSPENYIKQKGRNLPIAECWVNSGWDEDGLANAIVARKHTSGNFTVGMYLVDLKCLGVKDAQYFFNMSSAEYRDLLGQSRENMDIECVPYKLIHNIIYAGIEFADDYGFQPHKDFLIAGYILEEDTEDIELIEISCGKEDKPFYVRGPFDSDTRAKQIIAQLEKTAGSGNYTFIDTLDNPWNDDLDDDEFDLDEAIDNEKKETLELFFKYFSRLDKLTDYESEEFDDLIDSIFIDLVDLEMAEDYYDDFMSGYNEIKVLNEVPTEMFKDCGIASEQLDDFKSDFSKVLQSIDTGQKSAAKQLKTITEKYPDNAATRYLNLFLLNTNESRKFDQLIKESLKVYPHFPLINLLGRIHELRENVDNNDFFAESGIDFRNVFDKAFPNRKTLYVVEVFYLIEYLVLSTSMTLSVEHIEALGDILNVVNLNQEDVELLRDLIKLAKMTFIIGLIEGIANEE